MTTDKYVFAQQLHGREHLCAELVYAFWPLTASLNSFRKPYTIEDWEEDIRLAIEHSIDGFALNVGLESWQFDRVADCFTAAAKFLPSNFKLFVNFDMAAVPCQAREDIDILRKYISLTNKYSTAFRIDGSLVITTFAGENSRFGFPSLESAWSFVKNSLEEITPIHFVPSFFIDPARYRSLRFLDGIFNWNGSWPTHLDPSCHRREIQNAKLDTDRHHLDHLDKRTFMAAVSPWFFTHYGPDSWNKNWLYRGDDWLYVRRWEQLISMRNKIDIVQIISWNDYGESHYIAPVRGAQPNSELWVDGFPHVAWLHLTKHYARAFKEGVYPPVERDVLFLWARPHPKVAIATEDKVPRPDNWELVDDVFWVVVFATGSSELSLSTGLGSDNWQANYHVPAGITKLSHPLREREGMAACLYRDGVIVAECCPNEFMFDPNPKVYNFNAFTAMSS